MKEIILVGLGEFGEAWYKTLGQMENIKVIAVDKEIEDIVIAQQDTNDNYSSLEEAIKGHNPEFIINATPPQVHQKINNIAFAAELPVLSEKPIADDYFSAVQMVDKAQRKGIPFAIAENYRNFPIVEQMKEYISSGKIGELRTIDILFRKDFKTNKQYFNNLANPLLFDVAIHHLDLMRYLTEKEALSVLAKNFNPKESYYIENSAAHIFIELQDEVYTKYNGNLVVQGQETDWLGNWLIEGTKGIIKVENHQLELITEEERSEKDYNADLYLEKAVKQFIKFLETGEEPKTVASDYIKTQALLDFIEKSSAAGKVIKL